LRPLRRTLRSLRFTAKFVTEGVICSKNKNIIKQGEERYFTVIIQLFHSNTKIEVMEQMKGQAFILISNESILKHIFKTNCNDFF
jgi:hypothetical protein